MYRKLLLLAMLAGTAAIADDAVLTTDVRTGSGIVRFVIDHPGADASSASRLNNDRADKHGVIPAPSAGFVLTNRVVVRTDNEQALGAIVGNSGTFAPFAPAPGFWIVTTDTVADAVDFAAILDADPRIAEAYVDIDRPKSLRAPTDPGYPLQWHLNNTSLPIADVNAEPAWALGYVGTGVIIGILEGGWQYNHPDLAANYNAAATQSGGSSTSHGTSTAGVAGAVANNGQGGVGVAYGAQISGQIYGSESQTAAAFEYRNDLNDIKSNSWGPWDDGTTTYLSSVERTAIENSIATGRGGLGEIFAWAAGNGDLTDRVEYDPYASSRYTLAIGAIGDLDTRAWYNEQGSSMLVVTQSNGNNRGIYTTTSGSGYTSSFGGTSSASPLGAGVVALMLQANPNLNWRDVQHVLINSTRKCDPTDPDWTTNAAGHDVSYDYGYGAIDAFEAVTLAETWTGIGPEVVADSGVVNVGITIPDNNGVGVTQTFSMPDDIIIESVELILNVTHTYVGDLQIELTAPSGTHSLLAKKRADPRDDYVDYIFTSLRCWDETSSGTWTVKLSDLASSDTGTWDDYRIKVYGTALNNCPPDYNGDTVLDSKDFIAFLNDFTAGNADYNGDTVTDSKDFIAFLNDFVAGC